MDTDAMREAEARWVTALDAAEALYRLAEKVAMAGGRRLADQMTAAAVELPADAASGALAGTRARLETLVELAVRLGYVPAEGAALARSALGRVTEAPRPAPATAPSPPDSPPQRFAAPVHPAPRGLHSEASPIEPAAPVAKGPDRDAAARPGHGQDRIVIDGSNFLGRAPGYDLGDVQSQERLLFRLQEYVHQHPAHKVSIYFDGRHVVRQLAAGVEVHVTSGNRPADDVMIDFLRQLPAPDRRRCTLVSDDRDLGARARQQGIRVESVAWLNARLTRAENTPNAHRQPGLNRGELAEWEAFFNAPPKRPGKS